MRRQSAACTTYADRLRLAASVLSLCLATSSARAESPEHTAQDGQAAALPVGASARDATHARADAARAREARAEFERGREAYRKGKLEHAAAHLRNARELSASPELAFDLARIHERMGDAQTARALYAEFLASAGTDRAQRRDVEHRLAALDALEQRQREQLVLQPPSASALGEEARVLFQHGIEAFRAGRYEAALAAFTASQSAVRLPEHAYNLALTCERLGRARDAVDYYRAYLAHAQDTSETARVQERITAMQQTFKGPRPRR